MSEAPSSVRNPPVQERSRALLERILISAGVTFDELGIDASSTEEIARRAGVSIGAIYRFFPNKTAIAEGLAERYTAQLEATTVVQFTEESLTRPAEAVVEEFFARFRSLVARQPGWQALARAGYILGSRQARPAHEDWTSHLERFFELQVPALDARARRRAARTFQALSGWLLLHAVESREPIEVALREAQTVMVGYVAQLARRGS